MSCAAAQTFEVIAKGRRFGARSLLAAAIIGTCSRLNEEAPQEQNIV